MRDKDVVEMITVGDYYKRGSRHYVMFDEGDRRLFGYNTQYD